MSVPKYQRNVSKVEFINQSRELCVYLAKTIIKVPKKYKFYYSDRLLQLGSEIYEDCFLLNEIYLDKNTMQSEYEKRISYTHDAIGKLSCLSSLSSIFFDLMLAQNDIDENKTYYQIKTIGEYCNNIKTLLKGLLKSDKERYAKYKSN